MPPPLGTGFPRSDAPALSHGPASGSASWPGRVTEMRSELERLVRLGVPAPPGGALLQRRLSPEGPARNLGVGGRGCWGPRAGSFQGLVGEDG